MISCGVISFQLLHFSYDTSGIKRWINEVDRGVNAETRSKIEGTGIIDHFDWIVGHRQEHNRTVHERGAIGCIQRGISPLF
jgi:hypothetical protein